MFAKHTIYKYDHYNMLTVEVQGKTLVVREISDQWGEECHKFVSRAELMDWAVRRFGGDGGGAVPGGAEEAARILEALRSV